MNRASVEEMWKAINRLIGQTVTVEVKMQKEKTKDRYPSNIYDVIFKNGEKYYKIEASYTGYDKRNVGATDFVRIIEHVVTNINKIKEQLGI